MLDISLSVLPATLLSLRVFAYPRKARFIVDGPFPPCLKEWSANLSWSWMPKDFKLPDSLREIDCPTEVFGTHLKDAPRSLTQLDVTDIELEALHVQNFPSHVSELLIGSSSREALLILPKTLSSLWITSLPTVGILTKAVCERLESLESLTCDLHLLEHPSCLQAFKCLKALHFRVCLDYLADETSLFSNLSVSTVNTIESVVLDLMNPNPSRLWPTWVTQLRECPRLERINCTPFEMLCGNDCLPLYLKCLPPSLTELGMPPMPMFLAPSSPEKEKAETLAFISSPEFVDCFHHFPKSLTDLSFGYPCPNPSKDSNRAQPIMLPDDCFTHLPPSLTHLNLLNVVGLTERFWDIIPPHIAGFQFNGQFPPHPSFGLSHEIYLSKFDKFT
jgi:hypothetical protein